MSQNLLSQLITAQGHSFWWLQFYAIAMFFSLCFVAGVITRAKWNAKPPPGRMTDMWYWLTAPSVRMVSRVIVAGLMIMGAGLLGLHVSPELFNGFGPVAQQPAWLLMIELLLLMDLSSYWIHRLFHTVPFLWRFHAIHHSATQIRWSTTARVHPVNELFNYTFAVVPLFLLGFPIGMMLAVIPLAAWYAIACHAEWNPSFGPVRKIFSSPRFHRWHHTMSHEGGNKNFANVFSLWDWLFGSYYLPDNRVPQVFGLDDEVMPENFAVQMLAPFRKKPAADAPAAVKPGDSQPAPTT